MSNSTAAPASTLPGWMQDTKDILMLVAAMVGIMLMVVMCPFIFYRNYQKTHGDIGKALTLTMRELANLRRGTITTVADNSREHSEVSGNEPFGSSVINSPAPNTRPPPIEVDEIIEEVEDVAVVSTLPSIVVDEVVLSTPRARVRE
jgi:hypothetical protein